LLTPSYVVLVGTSEDRSVHAPMSDEPPPLGTLADRHGRDA
jgi:hypothetical protein